MAEVKLIIRDVEGGSIGMVIESDPPIPEGLKEDDILDVLTPAQKLAVYGYKEIRDVILSTGGKEWGSGGSTN